MRSQGLTEPSSAWLLEETNTSATWSDDMLAQSAALDKDLLFGFVDDSVVDKVNDHKLAHDVDDLSAIFEQLEEGTVDFSLPGDESEEDEDIDVVDVVGAATPLPQQQQQPHEDWIDDLDQDAANVEELSAAFDLLAEQVETASDDASDDAEEDEDEDEDADDRDDSTVRIVPAAPTWIAGPPLDPRSLIQKPIFQNVDPRIPSVAIPRMDLGFGDDAARCRQRAGGPAAAAVLPQVPTTRLSPRACVDKDGDDYKHDPATCWICKSDKTAFKKFALHRYLEKRRRRNWKRGPRYSGRSHVATNRVREGGRFVCTARWI